MKNQNAQNGPKVLNFLNRPKGGSQGEALDYKNSLTTPGSAYTIEELIQRFARGEQLPIGRQIYYDGEDPTEADLDPTLNPDYDLSDAFHDIEKIKKRQAKRAEDQKDTASPANGKIASPAIQKPTDNQDITQKPDNQTTSD